MLIMLIVIYLGGWLAVTCAAYAAGTRLTDRESPPGHPLMISVAAGAIWPLLLVGLVELGSIIAFTKVHSKPASNVGILA
jgi:hypothetical protein